MFRAWRHQQCMANILRSARTSCIVRNFTNTPKVRPERFTHQTHTKQQSEIRCTSNLMDVLHHYAIGQDCVVNENGYGCDNPNMITYPHWYWIDYKNNKTMHNMLDQASQNEQFLTVNTLRSVKQHLFRRVYPPLYSWSARLQNLNLSRCSNSTTLNQSIQTLPQSPAGWWTAHRQRQGAPSQRNGSGVEYACLSTFAQVHVSSLIPVYEHCVFALPWAL